MLACVLRLFLRRVMLIFNSFIMLTGVVLVVYKNRTEFGYIDDALTPRFPIYMLVVGSVIIMISIIGFCGGILEHAVLLYLYSAFMVLLMVGSILFVAIIIPMIGEIEKCCETHGAMSNQTKGLVLSDSCCATPPCTFDKVTLKGCVGKNETFSTSYKENIQGTVIGLAFVQVLQAVISGCLAHIVR